MNTIETKRLRLRPITEGDAEAMFDAYRTENVGINAGWKPHENITETREVMKAVFLDQESVFGMELKESGAIVGTIGLIADPKRQNDRSRMIGYAIAEGHWGNGLTTEAVRALVRFGFDEMGLDLISAYCYPFNERSKRVLKKCGFRYEGTLRRAEERYDGKVIDNDCFSIIRDEVVPDGSVVSP